MRRRLMMGKEIGAECPYITGGLIFWLDGLSVDSDSLWVEKIGGRRFSLSGCIKQNDGVAFNGSTSYGICNAENFAGETIEAAFSNNDTANACSLFSQLSDNYNRNIILLRSKTGIIYTRAVNYSIQQCIHPKLSKEIVSALSDGSYAIVNGNAAQISTGDKSPLTGAGQLYLGQQPSGAWKLNGVIHSIRVYNRKLSQEEMIANQHIDNVRFNMGL